jgi:hypothetical protein
MNRDCVNSRCALMPVGSRCTGDNNLAQVQWRAAKYLYLGWLARASGPRETFEKCNWLWMDNVIDAFSRIEVRTGRTRHSWWYRSC